MAHPGATLWIQPADPMASVACGGCAPGDEQAACRTGLGGETCAAPALAGPPDEVARVLRSLQQVVEPQGGRSIVDLQLVKSLRLEGGEAELVVTFPLRCGSARQLAESAFDTMRRLLPDTDVYVRHAA